MVDMVEPYFSGTGRGDILHPEQRQPSDVRTRALPSRSKSRCFNGKASIFIEVSLLIPSTKPPNSASTPIHAIAEQ
jgi:hypothetical protein